MNNLLNTAFTEHRATIDALEKLTPQLKHIASLLKQQLIQGKKVLVCGNGGSAADSQHFAAELTGRFEKSRKGLPAIALTTDSSALTAIGNDFGFNVIFARQVEALGQPGDVLIAISTSGNSANIVTAVESAKIIQMYTIGLLGGVGGKLATMVEHSLIIPSSRTARVQEAHIFLLHLLCELIES